MAGATASFPQQLSNFTCAPQTFWLIPSLVMEEQKARTVLAGSTVTLRGFAFHLPDFKLWNISCCVLAVVFKNTLSRTCSKVPRSQFLPPSPSLCLSDGVKKHPILALFVLLWSRSCILRDDCPCVMKRTLSGATRDYGASSSDQSLCTNIFFKNTIDAA